MNTAVSYRFANFDLRSHEFTIELFVSSSAVERARLTLPAWIPGSYMIRDFARNITGIEARGENGNLAIEKLDKQTWEVATNGDAFTVTYRVYAFDLSVRSAYLDFTRAFFNGTSVFLRVEGFDSSPCQVEIPEPHDGMAENWSIATTLPEKDTDSRGFGTYCADNYAELIDCPVEIGSFESGAFFVGEVLHKVIVTDGGRFDMNRICSDVNKICREHIAMFGHLPVNKYLFMTLATADGYGGLEHRDSTALICSRTDLPHEGMTEPSKSYRNFLGLCSHEYFHLWNVKRIRPERLARADLSNEAHTELLWAFEGITSYYDDLGVLRANVIDLNAYLSTVATTVTRVLRGPGRTRQSIAASSFDAWTKFYKQDENAPNAIVSYYAKGALVAFGLDLTLRMKSADEVSLDDLMRLLWQRYGKVDVGLPERMIERLVEEMLCESLDPFFDAYVYGTEELPLDAWFSAIGVGIQIRASSSVEDVGGCIPKAHSNGSSNPTLGARFEPQATGLKITHVTHHSPAYDAGLAAGDLLLAVDGERVTVGNLTDLLVRANGSPVDIYFFRRDRIQRATLTTAPGTADTCDLWLMSDTDAGPQAIALRQSWMRSSVDSTD